MHYTGDKYLGERPLLLQIYKTVELHKLSFYISDWVCKNMAIEISLIYLLTGSCSGVCVCVRVFFFLQLLLIYLICTKYLLNRLSR